MTNKNEIVQFRVDAASMAQLNAVGNQQELPISVMVRSWVIDRLHKELILGNSSRQHWQAQRLAEIRKTIEADFPAGPVLVIHAWPLTPNVVIEPSRLSTTQGALLPALRLLAIEGRINRQGYQVVSRHHNKDVATAQVFKTGQIEAVRMIEAKDSEIFGLMLDNDIVMSVLAYVGVLAGLQIPMPFMFSISLLRVKDYWLVSKPSPIPGLSHVAIQEDSFTLRDVIVADNSPAANPETMAQHLRSILDEIWQASGLAHSFSFERNGKWHGPWV